jgi:hypothetical protein
MAGASVDAGSALAQQIQSAIQPKLIENGWMTDENDQTLSEYVTMMLVNGKDQQGVQAELGNDLLGVGEDDPAVTEFTGWLFEQVRALQQPQQQENPGSESQQQSQETQSIPSVQDASMEDTPATTDTPYVNFSHSRGENGFGACAPSESPPSLFTCYDVHQPWRPLNDQDAFERLDTQQELTCLEYRPTGPRSMRNGSGPQRGRGGRMLGQMNRQMDRSTDLPDSLRRIKGAAGGQSGRINTHAPREGAPRGPKSNFNGMQRMMNGGRGGPAGPVNMNAMMVPPGTNVTNSQQLQFMQMMEMQANMFQQMLQQTTGQLPGMNGGQPSTRGGRGGHRGRGGHSQEPRLKAVNGKMPDGALPAGPGGHGDGMDVDGEDKGEKFSTPCRFDLSCTNTNCGFAHHGPTTHGSGSIDMTITCTFGVACQNPKCVGKHPSPAQRSAHNATSKQDVECKFYPNCTNARCPFRHPSDMPPCRNGADCTIEGCKFGHSKIMCRYNPCTNAYCTFKHADGQKKGKFQDKVWTAENGEGGKADRFADFVKQEGEELILPGRSEESNGAANEQEQDSKMETQAVDLVT